MSSHNDPEKGIMSPEAFASTRKKNLENFAQEKTGAVRESIGTKISTHLVPYEAIAAMAVGLNYGEYKYEARNFELGMRESVMLNSIDRHNRALMDGEGLDEDTQLPHFYLLASSVAMYLALKMRGTLIEDLPIPARRETTLASISEKAQAALKASIKHLEQKSVPVYDAVPNTKRKD